MARKRIELSPELNAEIAARAARGDSPETIAEALGHPELARTIRRRVDELRGKAPAVPPTVPGRASAPLPPGQPSTSEPGDVPDVPDEPPPGTPIEQIDRWLAKIDKAMAVAEADGRLQVLASLAQKAAALAALRHRTAPMPKADPNDRPDYLELARVGEERLLKLIRGTFAPNVELAGS